MKRAYQMQAKRLREPKMKNEMIFGKCEYDRLN